MMFLAMIGLVSLAAWGLERTGFVGHWSVRASMRVGLSVGLVLAGLDHIMTPGRYLPMIPPGLPFPADIVAFTGLCEIAGGIGLQLPHLRRLAGIMLAIYFVCVFPANIWNAINGISVDGLPTSHWYYWARLPFQIVFIWWALFVSRGNVSEVLPQQQGEPAS